MIGDWRNRWAAEPLAGATLRSLLNQLLGGIVIPLWAAGTLWWDNRDANYCFDAGAGRLALIDVDSLAAYADEILTSPIYWEQRARANRSPGSPESEQAALRSLSRFLEALAERNFFRP